MSGSCLRFLLLLVITVILPGGLSGTGALAAIPDTPDPARDPDIIEDEAEPPGIASGWIVGNRLLAEGRTADALPYLHMAYRAHPDVSLIAMDFQAALASEGYLKDALNVMDTLVAAYPDSQSFLLRRSALNLSAGHRDLALQDLQTIRGLGDPTVDVLAAESSILVADGKISQALDVLRDGLELFPDRGPDIYLEMARILRKAGEVESIPVLMDEAVARYPEEPLLWMVKIRALAALSRPDEALAAAGEADRHFADQAVVSGPDDTLDPALAEIAADPSAPEGMPAESFVVELADYYAQHNRMDEALAILQPLSDQGELGLTPSLWLARLLLGTGREKEGVELVDRILSQWPESGRGWFLRGKVDAGAGNLDKALPSYKRAAALAPYDAEIRLGLLRAMLITWESDLRAPDPDEEETRKIKEFRDNTMIASTLVPEQDFQGQMMLGYAFRILEDLERAAWRFNLAAGDPEIRVNALLQVSICRDENGEPEKARGALETLRREFPKDPEVANSFGYFLAEKGQDLDLAEGLIREALERDPGNGASLDSLGWVLYRDGRFEEAFDNLIKAVNVLPDDPVILEHLGTVLKSMGQMDEALDVLRRSLSMGGDSQRVGGLITEIENSRNNQE